MLTIRMAVNSANSVGSRASVNEAVAATAFQCRIISSQKFFGFVQTAKIASLRYPAAEDLRVVFVGTTSAGGFLTRLSPTFTPGVLPSCREDIVNEQEKPTAQPTPERPQARNTAVWVVVCAAVQPPGDNSESSRPTGWERPPGRTQRRGVRL
jgi:hypothetical protein